MKLVALSDLHGYLPDIPSCDAVLMAGDLCPYDHDVSKQETWLDTKFRRWLEKIEAPVYGVAGNHDFIFQELPERVPKLPWTYLQDSSILFDKYLIHGTPWQPNYGDYAFNLAEHQLYQKWQLIPHDTDILISHGPPRYYGDWCKRNIRVGSATLFERIYEVRPKLVICGHVHEDHGHFRFNDTHIYNVSLRNRYHKVQHPPTVIEL